MKNRNMILSAVTVCACFMAVGLWGEIPTITYVYNWTGGDSKAAFYEKALTDYAAANSGTVKLVLQGSAGDENRTKMKIAMAAGDMPDVFNYWAGVTNIGPFADAGVILPIKDFLAVSKATKKEQWTDAAWNVFAHKGEVYALPNESFKGFFVCNKAIFDKYGLKYPATYKDLLAVGKELNAKGIIPIAIGSKGGNPGHLFLNDIVYQFEGGVQDGTTMDTSFKFATPAITKAAEYVAAMRKANLFPKDTISNGDWGPSVAPFNQGKAAMIYTYPWMIGAIDSALYANCVIIPFPTMPEAKLSTKDYNIGGITMGYCINKKSFNDPAKQAALVKFVDFLVSDEVFVGLGANSGMMPAKKVALPSTGLNPLFVKVVDFTNTQKATYEVMYSHLPIAETVFNENMDALFAGVIDSKTFVSKVQKAFDLAKAKKK